MSECNKAKIGITITLKAKTGKESELGQLLSGAAETIKLTEPETLFWYSARTDTNSFLISDGFNNEAAMQKHFNGKVAAALKEKASDLIVGGWEHGVLPNIQRSDILSMTV